MKKIQIGRIEYTVREMSDEEMVEQQIPHRPAGAYLMDNIIVLDDLTTWKVVDKEDVE